MTAEWRVMILEHDTELAQNLQTRLSQAGFKVSTVSHRDDACEAVDREHPHLVVVDWDMPGVVATNLIRHIHTRSFNACPRLIALSSFSHEQHVISGFELGLDDYVIKPCSMIELVARVRAILRRTLKQELRGGHVEFAQLQMDTAEGRVTVLGKAVSLRHMEFQVLRFLMQRPERAYSRETLLRRVWGTDSRAGLRAVDVTVQRVRQALTPFACENYIQTVRGVGYRLSINVAR